MTTFQIHPKVFADALKSVLGFTKDAKGIPDVLLEVAQGQLRIVAIGQHCAARQAVRIEGIGDAEEAVLVLGHNPEKTDVVDDLAKIAQGSTPGTKTGISSAKGATLAVTIKDGQKFEVMDGANLIGELPDTGRDSKAHDWLDENLSGESIALDGPEAFSVSTITKLSSIKSDSPVVDFARLKGTRYMVLKCGTEFMGLMTPVDRESFVQGGPWHDGPGSPEKLLS